MDLLVGVGKADITGPPAEVGFMGYWDFCQTGEGIHSRLASRAFVIESPADDRRVGIVCADLGMVFQAVHQAVLRRLRGHLGDLYTEKNLLLSATHTHGAPGGYSHHVIYNASMGGFCRQNFEVIVDGIVRSVLRAHAARTPGRVLIAQGVVDDCGDFRSKPAFLANAEVAGQAPTPELYGRWLDKTMTLLKFVDQGGRALGAVNWFAVHPTSMGQRNKLVSGDNKGYAEELFERATGVIGAFGNSCCGDVSPNIKYGVPDGEHDFERTREFGRKQYEVAAQLVRDAREELAAKIDSRQAYVRIDEVVLGPGRRTWPAALGLGMSPGSAEDSEGVPVWPEGTTRRTLDKDPNVLRRAAAAILPAAFGAIWPDSVDPDFIQGQDPKPILIPLGLGRVNGLPLVPSIVPLQILRLGSLALVAHPGELTTMAGRRLREAVLEVLRPAGVSRIVVVTYAGAYSSYATTREEYDMQHYEGGSTLYGPHTLAAYIQENVRLAEALRDGREVDPGPTPPDLGALQSTGRPGVVFDRKPAGADFGAVLEEPRPAYRRGETVVVKFGGAHPNNNLRTEAGYLGVERLSGTEWPTVHTDEPFCTFFRWARSGLARSVITVEWMIPEEAAPGTYRLRYFGDCRPLLGSPRPFIGTSRPFEVA
jgi:neutral ceramidase